MNLIQCVINIKAEMSYKTHKSVTFLFSKKYKKIDDYPEVDQTPCCWSVLLAQTYRVPC